MANEYTKRYLEKRKSQKEQTPSLYQLAKERTESQLKSYTPQPTQKQPAKTTTRVNKLDVQDERAYQSKKRSSFSERMKTAGSSSILRLLSKSRPLYLILKKFPMEWEELLFLPRARSENRPRRALIIQKI